MTRTRLLVAFTALAALSACEGDPVGPSGGPLLPGQSRLISGGAGSERLYTIDVPEGTGTLQVKLSEGLGDADLIVRYGAAPQPSQIDCSSETEGNEEECLFNLPTAGRYYILVYGYTSYADVRLIASTLPQSGAATLTSAVPVENLSGGAGSFKMFSISVPAGASSLSVTLSATGDVDLYVRRAGFPLLNQYDCGSFSPAGTESCQINAPQSGTWFIRVEGYDPYSAGTLTATISPAP